MPLNYEEYQEQMTNRNRARETINAQIEKYPELFPVEIRKGYKLNGWTEVSKKMPEKRLRRIQLTTRNEEGRKIAYTIASCDVLPYMVGMVSDVENALYLKQYGVPDSALTYLFGRDDSYWYRVTVAFGRYNIVGSTVKDAAKLPKDVLADEKHAKAHGQKWYIPTTVGNDCVLGIGVSATADEKGLTQVYEVFKTEAQTVCPEYEPESVNTDGWAATRKAWTTLFPNIVMLLCFLHAFIKIRSCCKRTGHLYGQIKQQVWEIYDAFDRSQFDTRIKLLQNWVMDNRDSLTSSAIDAIDKLCRRADQYALALDHPNAYRTSNMIDRHMLPMARWLRNSRYFHGNLQSADLRMRAWALLHNYWPYCPRAKVSDLYRSPAHKLNRSIYRDNWLENLLVSTSGQGFYHSHKKRLN